MSQGIGSGQGAALERLNWVDTGKGFCIILVVLMHVTLGLETALERTNWLDPFIEWARMFRMPAFFMLSGLFVSRVVDRSWPEFLDRKILPFVYFYLLWLIIQCALKFPVWGEGGPAALLRELALGLVQPFGILWFIYLLAVFFLVTRMVRGYAPGAWLLAAALAASPAATGWYTLDLFTKYYVYFLSGALFAPLIFRIAGWVGENRRLALLLWLAWAGANLAMVTHLAPGTIDETVGLALLLGHIGALGLIALAALLAGRMRWVDHCGRNSLPIYLAFFVPMALGRTLLIKAGLVFDVGTVALLLTAVCVALPLLLQRLVTGSRLAFLFQRPAGFALARRAATVPQPAVGEGVPAVKAREGR